VKIDLEQIRSLLAVVSQTDITELTIESGDEKITVKKGNVQTGFANGDGNHVEVATASSVPLSNSNKALTLVPQSAPQAAEANNVEEQAAASGYLPITSPMVGTFYRASGPTSAPFVEPGDRVSIGQTVCIIEAMKLMNDLPSEISGKVVKILVENGSTVEFGQPLMLVDPKG